MVKEFHNLKPLHVVICEQTNMMLNKKNPYIFHSQKVGTAVRYTVQVNFIIVYSL